MAPYIIITIATGGMIGIALPLALYWDRQQHRNNDQRNR